MQSCRQLYFKWKDIKNKNRVRNEKKQKQNKTLKTKWKHIQNNKFKKKIATEITKKVSLNTEVYTQPKMCYHNYEEDFASIFCVT